MLIWQQFSWEDLLQPMLICRVRFNDEDTSHFWMGLYRLQGYESKEVLNIKMFLFDCRWRQVNLEKLCVVWNEMKWALDEKEYFLSREIQKRHSFHQHHISVCLCLFRITSRKVPGSSLEHSVSSNSCWYEWELTTLSTIEEKFNSRGHR